MAKNNFSLSMVVFGIIAAFAVLTLAAPALAQKAEELKAGHKMMSDG